MGKAVSISIQADHFANNRIDDKRPSHMDYFGDHCFTTHLLIIALISLSIRRRTSPYVLCVGFLVDREGTP
jgi:hypothetical protein